MADEEALGVLDQGGDAWSAQLDASPERLIADLSEQVIVPAEAKSS